MSPVEPMHIGESILKDFARLMRGKKDSVQVCMISSRVIFIVLFMYIMYNSTTVIFIVIFMYIMCKSSIIIFIELLMYIMCNRSIIVCVVLFIYIITYAPYM